MNEVQFTSLIENMEHLSEQNLVLELDEQILLMLSDAINKSDVEVIAYVLNLDLSSIIMGPLKFKLEQLLSEAEPLFFKPQNEHFLDAYFLIKGHLYFMMHNNEVAKEYYKNAISFAFKYKHYKNYAFAINGYTNIDKTNVDTKWIASKFAHIFSNLNQTARNKVNYDNIYYHIRISLQLNKIDYVNNLLTKIEGVSNKSAVTEMMILAIKFRLKHHLKEFEEAYEIAKEIMVDPLFIYYKKVQELLFEPMLEICEALNKTEHAKFFLNQVNRIREDAFQHTINLDASTEEYASFNFNSFPNAVTLDQFKDKANKLLNAPLPGYTLVMSECLLTEPTTSELEQMLDTLDQLMVKQYKSKIQFKTLIAPSKLLYFIALSEDEVIEQIKVVGNEYREYYPNENSHLKRLIFAYVNLTEGNFDSIEQCLQHVYAHIYYRGSGGV